MTTAEAIVPKNFRAGQMASHIAAHDWSVTPLGPSSRWPQTLKAAMRMMLASRYSMFLWWGKELINIYNDAYVPHLGQRHPRALGRPASEVWSEIWDVVGPQTEVVFRDGSSTWNEELLLVMERNAFTEETYFTFGYSPIMDEAGEICGLLGICTDETGRVLGRRRLRTLRDLGDRTSLQGKTAEDAIHAAALTLAENPNDVPFALVYLLDAVRKVARLADTVRVDAGSGVAPVEIAIGSENDIWEFGRILDARTAGLTEHSTETRGRIIAGAWPEPVQRAVVVPLAKAGIQDSTAGFLVSGVSPRLVLDDDYRAFLELTAGHIATAVANARAYEDERKRAEALAEIDRAKTAFFSNVSHEFRTPLTLMLGPIENLLAKDKAMAPEDREQLETAHRNSLRLLKLVNSLLDFSRIEAGRIRASYEPVELATLTAELASNFRSAMQAAGLDLIIECSPLSEPVYVDREMWEKIVLNLLSNAFKFTFQGSVTVAVKSSGNHAVLTVSDTGTGIREEELPHIFERFHRVEGAKGRTFEGSGIGLALIQELTKLHGGNVEVASRVGKGSTFTVRIPFGSSHLPQDRLAHAERAMTAVRAEAFTGEAMTWLARDRLVHPVEDFPAHRASPETSARARILLADDNADMREHVSRILGAQYETIAISDGLEALSAAREHQPDLILTDIMMPGLDGFGLLRELRNDPRTRELPVILLSARAGGDARTEGITAGADDYLTKPFTARELLARVETRLSLVRLRREVRAQFEALLNQAPMGVVLVDGEFRIRQVNPAALPAFGEIPDLIGRDLEEIAHIVWPKPFADGAVQRFRHTLETGESYSDPELIQRRLDRGIVECYEWRIDRLPLSDGQWGVVCYFRDISAQVQARNAIARSEERFRALVTASSDVVYSMSPDWSEMRSLRGRDFVADTADPTHSWLEKYIHPDDQPQVLAAIQDAIRNKTFFELEHRVRRVDGSLGWTFSRAVPLLDANGEITEWVGAAQDVTVRKEAEERLREAAERLRFMAESMPQKIFTAKPNGEVDYFNQQWMDYTGLTFEQIRDWGWTQFIHPEEVDENVRIWRYSIATGEPFLFTHRFRRADGAYRWHLSRAHAMRDRHGNITMWIGSNTEIHDQKIKEEELRRANTALEQFAYSASHDLQEPLRTVKIYSELLAEECPEKLEGEALDYLNYIRSGATRMEALIRDLLAYTQTSLVEQPTENVDSATCLQTTIANLAGAIAESEARIEADSLPSLPVHAAHLQQLFQNLVGNAIKYRRGHVPPVIRVAARPQEEHWVFSVNDNGIGIEPEYQEGIFGLFKRLHTSDEYSGTGLGLAICKRIVEHYNGLIWVESEPGKGSTFYFTLPA